MLHALGDVIGLEKNRINQDLRTDFWGHLLINVPATPGNPHNPSFVKENRSRRAGSRRLLHIREAFLSGGRFLFTLSLYLVYLYYII